MPEDMVKPSELFHKTKEYRPTVHDGTGKAVAGVHLGGAPGDHGAAAEPEPPKWTAKRGMSYFFKTDSVDSHIESLTDDEDEDETPVSATKITSKPAAASQPMEGGPASLLLPCLAVIFAIAWVARSRALRTLAAFYSPPPPPPPPAFLSVLVRITDVTIDGGPLFLLAAALLLGLLVVGCCYGGRPEVVNEPPAGNIRMLLRSGKETRGH
jgi:hypothetical protein